MLFQFRTNLTHFWLMFPFYTPWKHQKTKDIGRKWVKLCFADFVDKILILRIITAENMPEKTRTRAYFT